MTHKYPSIYIVSNKALFGGNNSADFRLEYETIENEAIHQKL